MDAGNTITIYHMHFVGWEADIGFGCMIALIMAIGFIFGRASK